MTTTLLRELQRDANVNLAYEEMGYKVNKRPYIFLSNGKLVRSYKSIRNNNCLVLSTFDMASISIEDLKIELKEMRKRI